MVGEGGAIVVGLSGYTERPMEPRFCEVQRKATSSDAWQEIELPPDVECLRDLTFLSDTQGYALATAGYGAETSQPAVLVTDDGGASWRISPLGDEVPPDIFGIFAASDGTVYAYSNDFLYRGHP